LSPFCIEAKKLLDNLDIDYNGIGLGSKWIPGLIGQGGSPKRAALLEMTGQSYLPNIFIEGKSIGGLFSGSPGLVPALEQGLLRKIVERAVDWMLLSMEKLAEGAEQMAKPVADFQKLKKQLRYWHFLFKAPCHRRAPISYQQLPYQCLNQH
jgi:hypothetical protein